MIPKKIHYCWFGGKPLPDAVKECISSWREKCPDYEIIEWNETNFDVNDHPYMANAYREKAFAFVSDLARLMILFEHGGIYLDTDVKMIRSFDPLLRYPGFAGIEKGRPNEKGRNYLVATGLGFGCEAGNKVVAQMLKEYDGLTFYRSDGSLDRTPCPARNTKALIPLGYQEVNRCQQLGDFQVFSSEYFCPMDYVTGKISITRNTFSVHMYSFSWQSGEDQNSQRRAALRCHPVVLLIKKIIYPLRKSIK